MLSDWQQHATDEQKERVRRLGLLTSLSGAPAGGIRQANFERGLVLQRYVVLARPSTVLELGTGRGFGALAISDAAREQGLNCEITSVDPLPPTALQAWPIELDGERTELHTSIDHVWGKYIDEGLRQSIRLRTGHAGAVLPSMAREKRRFDLVVIEAGCGLYPTIHDLSYAVVLLAAGGTILLHTNPPLEEAAFGSWVAAAQARRWFAEAEEFATEGRVYSEGIDAAACGMIRFGGLLRSRSKVSLLKLLCWRFAGALLDRCHRSANSPFTH